MYYIGAVYCKFYAMNDARGIITQTLFVSISEEQKWERVDTKKRKVQYDE